MVQLLTPKRAQIGIIGCGNIFPAYAKCSKLFPILELKACADLSADAAAKQAKEFGIIPMSIEELLADSSISLVINLTIPKVHAQVSRDILAAGKHAYSEKPLGTDLEQAKALVNFAAEKGLRLGCAPDTFLGAGFQTCRKLIDDGWIGQPIGGSAMMLSSGPESWHPNPAFFYERGAGPMFDMGPYYITALVHLLGPVQAVSAMVSKIRSERMATCKEQLGKMLSVEIPTHYSGSLLFQNGAIINLGISFDVQAHLHKPIEIYGTQGSISAPDPNNFGGPVSLFRTEDPNWKEMPLTHRNHENARSIGVADMAYAIESGREQRCGGNLALHVLEVLCAFEESHNRRSWVDIQNQCAQPQPFPLGLPPGLLDE